MSGMNAIVWLFSGILAVVFVAVGVTRAYFYEFAKKTWPWVSDLEPYAVRTLGLVEMICGVGLILPVVIGQYTFLTPVAASMLMLLLVLAVAFHVRRHESDAAWLAGLLLVMVGVVFYGRVELLNAVL